MVDAIAGALEGVAGIRPAWIETVDSQRGEEPSQGDVAAGLWQALQEELRQARYWIDRYAPLL